MDVLRVILGALILITRILLTIGESGFYGGKHFAFSFLAHGRLSRDTPCVIEIVSAENREAVVEVYVPGTNCSTTFSLQAGQIRRLELRSLNVTSLYENEDATVIINSTTNIGVVGIIQIVRPSAAFQVIPERSTGNHYVIVSNKNRKETQFTITSYRAENAIDVHAPTGQQFTCNNLTGDVNNISSRILRRYETMFCKGAGMDFTGTTINSTFPVSVVAGGRVQVFPNGDNGYILEQMHPINAWGRHFAVAPFAVLNGSNYHLRIVAPPGSVANITIIGREWSESHTINDTFGFLEYNDPRAYVEVIDIFSNESISVTQYMTGDEFLSSPSMFHVPPLTQNKRRVLVEVFIADINRNIINIITNCLNMSGFYIDGLELDTRKIVQEFNGSSQCAIAYELHPGLHCVSQEPSREASFHVILYSWKQPKNNNKLSRNTYAMQAGLDVPPNYPTCVSFTELTTPGDTMEMTSIPFVTTEPEDLTLLESAFEALQSDDVCRNDTNSKGPADIAREIEELAMKMTAEFLDSGQSYLIVDLGVAVIEIQKVNLSSSEISTTVSIPSNLSSTEPQTSAFFSTTVLRKLRVQAIISIVFRSLGSMIDKCSSPRDSNGSDQSEATEMVGSKVLSLNIFPPISPDVAFAPSVEMLFPLQPNMPPRFANGSALCLFWNYTLGGWSGEGCITEFSNQTLVRCSCNHLTNFAVLMQMNGNTLSEAHQIATNVLTAVGCSFSVAGAFFTILTFILLRLKSDRVLIHINLAFAVGMAQILFLCLDIPARTQVECTLKASFLYYFYVAAFCWMLIEGVNLYLQAVVVFNKPGSRMKVYLAIGWLCPILPLCATLGYYRGVLGDDVAMKEKPVCFVRFHDDSIYFFVVPVLAIITLNVFFVSRVVCEIIKLAGGPHVINNRITRVKHGLRACVILLPVMGLTWVFGVLWQDNSTLVFMYLFIIFNSLQGFFVFFFHCLLNSEVTHTFRRKKEEWMNSFSRRSTFNLRVFRSEDSKKKTQTVDSNKLSGVITRNGSDTSPNHQNKSA